jgi:hypothetical protein
MKLDFNVLYDPRIKYAGDMIELLDSAEGRSSLGVSGGGQMTKALMRLDIESRPEASREVLMECKTRPQHLATGPLLYRILQLVDPEIDERVWIDELVQIMSVAYNYKTRSVIGLRQYLPMVPTGMFSFLEFRKSPNIEYFADEIIKNKNGRLARDVLCNPLPQRGLDRSQMHALLRQSIERNTDLQSWVKKTVPPHARKPMYDNTGFQELIEMLPRMERGKALEDAMGL